MQKWIDKKRKEYEAEERAKKIAEEERQRKERVQREKLQNLILFPGGKCGQ